MIEVIVVGHGRSCMEDHRLMRQLNRLVDQGHSHIVVLDEPSKDHIMDHLTAIALDYAPKVPMMARR